MGRPDSSTADRTPHSPPRKPEPAHRASLAPTEHSEKAALHADLCGMSSHGACSPRQPSIDPEKGLLGSEMRAPTEPKLTRGRSTTSTPRTSHHHSRHQHRHSNPSPVRDDDDDYILSTSDTDTDSDTDLENKALKLLVRPSHLAHLPSRSANNTRSTSPAPSC